MTPKLRYLPGEHVSVGGRPCKVERAVSLTRFLVKDDQSKEFHDVSYVDIKPLAIEAPKTRPSRPIHSLNERQLAEARRRFEIIRPLLEEFGRIGAAIRRRSEETNVSVSTINRWLRRYTARGLLSDLVPRSWGKTIPPRIDKRAEAVIKAVLDDFYQTLQKPTQTTTIREIHKRCKRAGIQQPHSNTIRARIKALDRRKAMEKREGVKAARDKFGPVGANFPHGDHPLAVVQIDHTKVDLEVVDDKHRLPIGRPWLTLAIDVYSRMIVGFYLSLEAPSAFSVGQCIAHAVLQKHGFLEKHKIVGDWPVWGKMATLHADNGMDFRSRTIMKACEEHGINIEWRPVKKPHWGGHIERLMGTLSKEIHSLPGTTFSNVKQKGTYNSAKHATLTMDELEQILTIWIVDVYHRHLHTGIKMTPYAKWELGILGSSGRPWRGHPDPVPDEDRLRTDFLPYTERTVQRHGIEWDIRYSSNDIAPFIQLKIGGRVHKFIVRRDPRDISVVKFLDPKRNVYIDVPCGWGYPSTSIWEFRAAKARLKAEGNKNPTEHQIFEEIGRQNIAEIVEDAKKTTRKTRRLDQRKKAWRDGRAPDPSAQIPRAAVNDDEEFDLSEDDLKPVHEEMT